MSGLGEQVLDLRDVTALDADAAGTVYTLLRDEDGDLRIVLLDGRQEVLGAQQRQGSLQEPVRISGAVATQAVRTQPAIDFDVRALQVAPSGRYLLLHGSSYQDSSIIVMAVVDLHGGQPLPAGALSRGAGTPRQKQCRLHLVDPVLFDSRPGLVLFQASWHPHSEEHLVVLTSDNRLRLYRVTHSLAVAEQTLHVVLGAGALPQRYGLGTPVGVASPLGAAGAAAAEAPASADVVAFAFGPAVGWGLFSMLLLAADGQVYVLGPVAPFGMRCSAALLERLGQEEAGAADWLEAAFGREAVQNPSAKNRWPVLPHVVEGVSPALVGPLYPRTRQELIITSRAVSLVVAHTLTLAAGGTAAAAGAPCSVSTAVVCFADGRLLAYAVAGPWSPSWCEAAPQYMSVNGISNAAPSAVRYKCTFRGGDGDVAATPRMALLDIVELPAAVSRRSAAAGRTGAKDSDADEGGDDDEEDDELYGEGVSASAVAAARRAMSAHIQPGMGGTAVAGVGGAVTVWVCQRAGGCWRVTLPWSAMLPRWLGVSPGAAGGAAAASIEPLPAELPAPVVTCVYDARAAAQGSTTPAAAVTAAGSATVIGSCLMANPLLGEGLLMLSAEGSLHYFQPAGAASILLDQQQSAASPQQQLAAVAGGVSPRLPAASPEQRKAQVEAHIKGVYGNLLTPPADRQLPKPPAGAPSPLTVAIPEGLRHLTDCIATLRGKHVAFLHGTSVDLQGRAESLRAEAGKHAAAVAELSEMAAGMEARQGALEARLSRLKLLHDNLVERAGMLASLHWSLPRALSRAEVAVRDELANLETRASSLQAQWDTIAGRGRRLCEERRSGGPESLRAAGVRVASVPEAQLEKVHDAIVAQYQGLNAARSALAALEKHVTAAAADKTAQELEKGLGLGGVAGAAAASSGGMGLGLGARVA